MKIIRIEQGCKKYFRQKYIFAFRRSRQLFVYLPKYISSSVNLFPMLQSNSEHALDILSFFLLVLPLLFWDYCWMTELIIYYLQPEIIVILKTLHLWRLKSRSPTLLLVFIAGALCWRFSVARKAGRRDQSRDSFAFSGRDGRLVPFRGKDSWLWRQN